MLSLKDDSLYLAVYGMDRKALGDYLIKHCCDSRKVPKSDKCIAFTEKLMKQMDFVYEYEAYERVEVLENLLELIHRLVDNCQLEEEVVVGDSNAKAMRRLAQLED